MDRTFLLIGAVAAFIGVAAGAFGAHALRSRLSTEMLAVFETGVRYQMYHALAILLALLGMTALGAITPIGGLAFLAGWACRSWPRSLSRSERRSIPGSRRSCGAARAEVPLIMTTASRAWKRVDRVRVPRR